MEINYSPLIPPTPPPSAWDGIKIPPSSRGPPPEAQRGPAPGAWGGGKGGGDKLGAVLDGGIRHKQVDSNPVVPVVQIQTMTSSKGFVPPVACSSGSPPS